MSQDIVAIIPAKMTSQRLPKKNVVDLCGYPLIYYSIEIAKQVSLICNTYVSSEDEQVLELAASLGAKQIHRPKELSKSDISNQDVLVHSYKTIGSLKVGFPDLVILLQPTHPLRMIQDITRAVQAMIEYPEYDSLFSVTKIDELRGQIINKEFVPEFSLPRKRNNEPDFYKNTGSFYIFRPETSFMTPSFFGRKIFPFVLESSLFEIDIDYPEDLEIARYIMSVYHGEFSHFNLKPSSLVL